MAQPVLKCQHLGIQFGGLKAVDDFNMEIGESELVGLIGPNGAGKTTVFNLITGVYKPTEGSLYLNGERMNGKKTHQIVHAGIARTFQNIRLFDNMTVEENVRIGLHNQIKYGMFSGIFRLPQYWQGEKKQHEKALDLLSIFGMENMGDVKAGSLPYGAQRRLEIVRALATNPEIIYFDEPTSALDPELIGEVLNVMRQLAEEGMTMLVVTHEMNFARHVSNRVVFMEGGRIIEQNGAQEFFAHPKEARTQEFLAKINQR